MTSQPLDLAQPNLKIWSTFLNVVRIFCVNKIPKLSSLIFNFYGLWYTKLKAILF